MTTTDAPSKGSKLKDLVVTAAVASVVSALVYPWMRRWLDPMTMGMGPGQVLPPASPTTEQSVDEFEARLERMLEVPDPFAHESRRERGRTTQRRNDADDADDDDDLGP